MNTFKSMVVRYCEYENGCCMVVKYCEYDDQIKEIKQNALTHTKLNRQGCSMANADAHSLGRAPGWEAGCVHADAGLDPVAPKVTT